MSRSTPEAKLRTFIEAAFPKESPLRRHVQSLSDEELRAHLPEVVLLAGAETPTKEGR